MKTKSTTGKSQVHRMVRNFMISLLIFILALGFAVPLDTVLGLGNSSFIEASHTAKYVPDANTVLLDTFDGATEGEEHGSVSYAPSLPGLGQSVDLDLGDWIKYTVPSWNNQYGTIEAWIYPDTYNYSIAMLQWYNTNTQPPAGYVGQFTLLSDGHLWWKSWGPPWPSDPNPTSSSIIPLGKWTHVAVTWSPAGTRLYVNGIAEFSTTEIWMPALNPTTYVYLNGWGLHDHGLMDEFRISNVARSEEEIRAYVAELLNSPPEITVENTVVSVDEGEAATNGGNISDADGDTVTLSASVGVATNNGDGTWSWSFPTSDGPAESQTVTITADDGNDGITTTSFDLMVNNVAPAIDSISVPVDPVDINDQPISVSATFSDPAGAYDVPYTCTVDYGDGIVPQAGVADFTTCFGPAHSYAEPGVYAVTVAVTDKDGGSSSATATNYIVIYDPEGGFVTGGGWIWSPEGAYTPDPSLTGKATFGFVSKYRKGASVPTGNTEFQFHVADLNFKSTSYDWLVIAGSKAKYKGTGTINGMGEYGFMLSAIDGSPDMFRIKIWDKATEEVVYDNQLEAADDADPVTAIEGGSIVVHKAK